MSSAGTLWYSSLAAVFLVVAASGQKPVRVLLVSGAATQERAAAAPLADALRQAGRFSVFTADDAGAITPAALARYDVLAMDCNGANLDNVAQHAVERFVQRGKGLALVRAGDCSVMAGAKRTGATGNAGNQVLRVRRTGQGEHRTVDDLGPAVEPRTGATALAFARPESGSEQAVAWTAAWGQGRVFQTRFGRNLAVRGESEFLELFVRGVEWAAMGAVAPRSAAAEASNVRALVVTGGHTYDASFYALFEDQPGITAIVDPHPMPYRRGDLRARCDTLVLYDSMQVIGDSERMNLTNFVESGKGLVILHHALVDYSDDSWFWRDIMGARWLKVGGPGSKWKTTWKHDVELLAYPVAEHPVTAGVGPMRIWDETYKGMWLSPDIKVLMRTDDPSSDGPVVWLSPYRKARVVIIELGHDRKAHLHPGYRKLVANAIRWSAGRK
jgi:type 1 glutamine amidotransferase